MRVQPHASRSEVVGWQGEVLRVRVAAPPEGGRANEALLELLARRLDLAPSRLHLLRGARSREKVVRVEGVDVATLRHRLGH